MSKILIPIITVILLHFLSCSNNSNNIQLQNENIILKLQLDSLQNSYDILNIRYINLKNKPPDTCFIFTSSDSVNWIDSVMYSFKDSLVLIPHDTTVIDIKDSIIVILHDTLITRFKDSLVYIYRDTLLYSYIDSIIICYDEKSFPEESIEKYLNLFFRTDNIEDTAGLKYNFSAFDGPKRSYTLDTNYIVPDSIIGWRLEWYRED